VRHARYGEPRASTTDDGCVPMLQYPMGVANLGLMGWRIMRLTWDEVATRRSRSAGN
jgi:hypothetical protein